MKERVRQRQGQARRLTVEVEGVVGGEKKGLVKSQFYTLFLTNFQSCHPHEQVYKSGTRQKVSTRHNPMILALIYYYVI